MGPTNTSLQSTDVNKQSAAQNAAASNTASVGNLGSFINNFAARAAGLTSSAEASAKASSGLSPLAMVGLGLLAFALVLMLRKKKGKK